MHPVGEIRAPCTRDHHAKSGLRECEDHGFLRQQDVGKKRFARLQKATLQVLNRDRARIGKLHEARIAAPHLVIDRGQLPACLRKLRPKVRRALRGVPQGHGHRGARLPKLGDGLLKALAALAKMHELRLARKTCHIGLTHHLGEYAALIARRHRERLSVVACARVGTVQLQQNADGLAVNGRKLGEKGLTRLL